MLDRLQQEKLQPAPEADRNTLLRRVSLDLIGMPAPEAFASAFLQDSTETAYEQLVDSLLASPQFGERWASVWLDLARYADSKGYERDAERLAWRYRDWLIRALNDDMPYDRFLTEQLAGDLLPNPSDAQLVATQFHRNTPTNDEGGIDNEEFRVAALLENRNGKVMPFKGRDHHAEAFTMWMAGGGIAKGKSHGETDEIGFSITKGKTTVYDI
ncbi:MAG: DUF1549 domain-containing protein [Bacteroidota bacterium]